MPSAFGIVERVANRAARHLPRRRIDVVPTTPIVTFTFDDVPVSAVRDGAGILEQAGVSGTFYVAGGHAGQDFEGQRMADEAEYRALRGRGHELGHHTFTHRRPLSMGSGYEADLDRNDAFLSRLMPPRAANFAFPFGISSPGAQRLASRRFRSGRSALRGINRGPVNRDYLFAVGIYGDSTAEALVGWIDDVAANPGWLIFYTHDVQETPTTYGCRPDTLRQLVGHARATGCEVLTVDAALDRLGVTT